MRPISNSAITFNFFVKIFLYLVKHCNGSGNARSLPQLVYYATYLLEIQKVYSKQKTIDPFENIKTRIEKDTINKRKVCAKYQGSTNPWLPVKSPLNVKHYYLDQSKKLGWCVNAKVSGIILNSKLI